MVRDPDAQQKASERDMNKKWFRKYQWIYLPISWQGQLVTLFVAVFNVQVFIAIDRNSHSVSDTLYGIFPYLVGSLAILFWVASNSSKK